MGPEEISEAEETEAEVISEEEEKAAEAVVK